MSTFLNFKYNISGMALITFFHMYSISSVMQMVTGRIYMGSEEKRAFLIACSIFIHYDVTD